MIGHNEETHHFLHCSDCRYIVTPVICILIHWADAPAPVFAFYRMGIGGLLITPLFIKAGLQKQIPSKKLLLLPIFSALLAFNEQLLPVQWLGTAAVLSGISLINRSNNQAKVPV